MKTCTRCSIEKEDDLFSFVKKGSLFRKSACKACHSEDARARYAKDPTRQLAYAKQSRQDPAIRRRINETRNATRKKNPALELWRLARVRARQKGLPFDIDVEDVSVPELCPVLQIKLQWGVGKRQMDPSPTVDRVIPELGYVRGNVRVISWRANRLKSDATVSELRAVLAYYEAELSAITAVEQQRRRAA